MPVPKGKRFGGRKKGTPNKITLARAEVLKQEAVKSGRKQFVAILEDAANQFYQLALAYAPHRERKADDRFQSDESKFREYMRDSVAASAHGAPFQTPKLQSTTLRNDQPDEPLKVQIEIVRSTA